MIVSNQAKHPVKAWVEGVLLDLNALKSADHGELMVETADEIARLTRERDKALTNRNGWAARSLEQFDRIGTALDPVRQKRPSGEPTRSDAEEVEALVRERDRLRALVDGMLTIGDYDTSRVEVLFHLAASSWQSWRREARAALRRDG